MTLGLSPSIEVNEQDFLSANVTTGTNFAGFVGNFRWGSADERILITDEANLVTVFDKPDDSNYKDWLSAKSYLDYNDKLLVVRTVGENSLNAGIEIFSEEMTKLEINITSEEHFSKGEIVTGGTSSATAEVVDINEGILIVKPLGESILEAEETITGGTSSATATIINIVDNVKTHKFNVLKKNKDSFVEIPRDKGIKFKILARYAGEKGNDIAVAFADSSDFSNATINGSVTFKSLFDFTPTSSEIAYVVMMNGVVVENKIVSLIRNAKNYKNENYYISDYINQKSKYIYCYDNNDEEYTLGNITAVLLEGGRLDMPTASDYINSYKLFKNKEEVNVDVIFVAGGNEVDNGETVTQSILDNIVDRRKDCRAVIGAREQDVVDVTIEVALNNLENYVKSVLVRDTSYGAFYGNYKYMKDTYNDVYRWVPVSGDCAGVYSVGNMWEAPAGLRRGQIKNCEKLAINPEESERDFLYPLGINPISTVSNVGHIIYGQKTLKTSVPSIFNRIDNRGLFILLEKTVVDIAKFYQFEKNDSTNRRKLVSDIEPIFTNIKGLGGMENFRIICDNTNNPDSLSNTLYVNIYVQPTGTAEWISITFSAVSDAVNFEEVA